MRKALKSRKKRFSICTQTALNSEKRPVQPLKWPVSVLRSSGKTGILLEPTGKEGLLVNKNSFIIYYDFEEQTAGFTDAQVGELIRMILSYEIRGQLPQSENPALKMAFRFLKPVLDCNRRKYEKMCERNRNNRRGGREKPPLVTSGTDTDTDTDTDTEKGSDLKSEKRFIHESIHESRKESEVEPEWKQRLRQSEMWQRFQARQAQQGIENTPR